MEIHTIGQIWQELVSTSDSCTHHLRIWDHLTLGN